MKKNNLNLDFNYENRIYYRAFKRAFKIILIYLTFSLILDMNFMFNVYMFRHGALNSKNFSVLLNDRPVKDITFDERKDIINLLTDFSSKKLKFKHRIAKYKSVPRIWVHTENYEIKAYHYKDYFLEFELRGLYVGGRFISEESLKTLFQKYMKHNFK